jgi:hypothetical protein
VEIEAISNGVAALERANANISQEFEKVKRRADSLGDRWRGHAGRDALVLLEEIYRGFDAREGVIRDYAKFLRDQVNPNYKSAEEMNTTLADQFK